jgi:hypothetical protein
LVYPALSTEQLLLEPVVVAVLLILQALVEMAAVVLAVYLAQTQLLVQLIPVVEVVAQTT